MDHSIFAGSSSHIEADPWKATSPKLGGLSLEESHEHWASGHLSEDDSDSKTHADENADTFSGQRGLLEDPLSANLLSGSQILEDQILGAEPLTSNIDTTTHTVDYAGDDTEMNENIWDVELTNSYDPLGFHNSSDKSFIRVKEIPEKEGLVFKHINYLVTHNVKFIGEPSTSAAKNAKGDIKIVRRYSDFHWLYEVLLKKYPFRAIPELPPKKFSGNTTSNDSIFLQNRRRGLQRFLNQLIKHPILNKENLIIMFLTVPNDFSNWKKFAKIDLSDEFEGIKIALPSRYRLKFKTAPREEYEEDEEDTTTNGNSPEHSNDTVYKCIETLWEENDNKQMNFVGNFHKINQNLTRLIELWSKLTAIVERFEKRQAAMAMDEQRFEVILRSFLENDSKAFQMDKLVDIHQRSPLFNFERDESQNLNIINFTLAKVSTFFQKKRLIDHEEISNMNSSHLENFKKFQDYLVAFNMLLERLIMYKVTSERANAVIVARIMKANEKLQTWLRKPDIKGSDFDKLNNFINLQISELNKNLYKIFLVKNCIKFEFKLFNKNKYLMSEIFQDWFTDKGKYGALYIDLLEKCLNDLQELPLR